MTSFFPLLNLYVNPLVNQKKSRINSNYCCQFAEIKLKLTIRICIMLVLHTAYAYNKILSLIIY